MLKPFYILIFTLSANCFAQSSVFKKDLSKSTGFENKKVLGTWTTTKPTYDHNLYIGGFSVNDFMMTTTIVPTNEEGDCSKKRAFFFNSQQDRNLKSINTALLSSQCKVAEKVKETRELNPDVCLSMANCYKARSRQGDGTIEQIIKAREKTASEAVALMSATTIDHLFDLEELKAYARAKYAEDFIPKECRDEDSTAVPPAESGICMTKIIDDGYELAQKSCLQAELGCNPDYVAFAKNKKTENGKTSLMSDFIKEKTKTNAKKIINEDTGITANIAVIMARESDSPEVRAKKVLKYLNEHFLELDPIYKYYVKNSIKNKLTGEKDEFETGLVTYLSGNNGKSVSVIVEELDVLRKKEAHKRLAENCPKVITVKKLCSIVNDVLNGAEVQVPQRNFTKLLNRQEFSSSDKEMTRQDMADNIARCNTFTIDTSTNSVLLTGSTIKLSNGLDLFSSTLESSDSFRSMGITGISTVGLLQDFKPKITLNVDGDLTKKETRDANVTQKISSSKEDKSKESVFTTSFTKGKVMDDVRRPEPKGVGAPVVKAEKIESYESRITTAKEEATKIASKDHEALRVIQQQAQQGIMPSKTVANVRQPEIIPESQNDSVTKIDALKKAVSPDYTSLMGKISSLEEKLAASQKRTTVESVENKTAIPEESELARELRMTKVALAELKASDEFKVKATGVKKKNVVATSDAEEEDDDLTIASSSSSAKDSRSSSAPASTASTSSSVASASQSGPERSIASIDDSRPGSHGSSSGSSSGSNGDSLSSGGDSIVLTRLDGISGSKVNETISNMIIAESGRPFYIEEGGLVKQIIPEVVDGVILKAEDGTPLYKTVVKGKVGEFKIDGKGKNKKEVVVKAASPADVKIEDYQKINTPAVRYREMQEAFKTKSK